ncbi:hypothetical protein BV898_08225 [Hypsibius exemplaris]|uniref:Uncharacterized protein n=1 Tax=Hypsibius exemplaris TaxID=2072580 RepID=A0A1W0WRE0_HYPEX|nr:hypothetical protein BV898_08225 [Hypsibius exemplaris]
MEPERCEGMRVPDSAHPIEHVRPDFLFNLENERLQFTPVDGKYAVNHLQTRPPPFFLQNQVSKSAKHASVEVHVNKTEHGVKCFRASVHDSLPTAMQSANRPRPSSANETFTAEGSRTVSTGST